MNAEEEAQSFLVDKANFGGICTARNNLEENSHPQIY